MRDIYYLVNVLATINIITRRYTHSRTHPWCFYYQYYFTRCNLVRRPVPMPVIYNSPISVFFPPVPVQIISIRKNPGTKIDHLRDISENSQKNPCLCSPSNLKYEHLGNSKATHVVASTLQQQYCCTCKKNIWEIIKN